MTRFIGILSGKGGCGKTTTSINLGTALTQFGKEVVVVDANLTTPNIGLHLGVPVAPIHLHQVLRGKNKLKDAVYEHYPLGTKIIPAGISVYDAKNTFPEKLKKVLADLQGCAEIVLVDGAAGLGKEAIGALNAVNEILVVTNPELPAITDALKTIKLAEEFGKDVIGVILTKTKKRNLDVSIRNVESILEKPVIAIVPDDKAIRQALVKKDAVVRSHPNSKAAIAYKKLAAAIANVNYEPKSFFTTLKKFILP